MWGVTAYLSPIHHSWHLPSERASVVLFSDEPPQRESRVRSVCTSLNHCCSASRDTGSTESDAKSSSGAAELINDDGKY
jgi:HD-like signal output (HDOD) protein